ncbi:MAG: DUF4111 domain-containing protein [Spirochaetaceae bacterium]|nr:DUF4111 domain-containing protein [Spirochaetaceae bacterium]
MGTQNGAAKQNDILDKLTGDFVRCAKKILNSKDGEKSDNLTGVYLHGSAVMGCFNPEKSDIDLIVVVNEKMTDETKRRFMDMVVELNAQAPQKGIEMSVVLKSVCSPFVYPTPFELHFSNMHLNWYKTNPDDYVQKMKGTDKDLAAHFTNIRKHGRCLYGAPIADVFAEVPKHDYLDSIHSDIAEAEEDIIENPTYIILNLARVLAYQKDEQLLSKKEGGEWGLKKLPVEFHNLLKDALKDYEGSEKVTYNMECAKKYADYMLKSIM